MKIYVPTENYLYDIYNYVISSYCTGRHPEETWRNQPIDFTRLYVNKNSKFEFLGLCKHKHDVLIFYKERNTTYLIPRNAFETNFTQLIFNYNKFWDNLNAA